MASLKSIFEGSRKNAAWHQLKRHGGYESFWGGGKKENTTGFGEHTPCSQQRELIKREGNRRALKERDSGGEGKPQAILSPKTSE